MQVFGQAAVNWTHSRSVQVWKKMYQSKQRQPKVIRHKVCFFAGLPTTVHGRTSTPSLTAVKVQANIEIRTEVTDGKLYFLFQFSKGLVHRLPDGTQRRVKGVYVFIEFDPFN